MIEKTPTTGILISSLGYARQAYLSTSSFEGFEFYELTIITLENEKVLCQFTTLVYIDILTSIADTISNCDLPLAD